MQINSEGLNLIKEFEGCKLKAYQDIVGKWTIGYGHTGPEVVSGYEITQEQAEEILKSDLKRFEQGVQQLVKVQLTNNQFSALVSFSYNLGLGNLKQSTLLNCINKHNVDNASGEFLKWCKAGGVVVPGLLRRRKAEQALFNKT